MIWKTSKNIPLSTFFNRREVSFAEGAAFAQKYGIKFFETSAKTAQNVEEAFLSTANIILDNIEKG